MEFWSPSQLCSHCSITSLSLRCAGAAQIRCLGHVRIEPGSVVPMGSNVSITCVSALTCPRVNLSILLNLTAPESPPRPLNSSAAQLQLRGFRLPFSIITCLARCSDSYWKKVVCGTELWAGYPPDPPANLSCAIPERSGSLVCTWDAGQPTLLHTNYSLHLLSDGTDTLCFSEESLSNKFGLLVLSTKLNFESTYRLVVVASNKLGSAFSQPLKFMLIDIGKCLTHLPAVSTEKCMNVSLTLFPCEFNAVCPLSSLKVGSLNSDNCSLHGLEPHTEYEFQVSCKIHPERGLWSNWSTFQSRTPEAVPIEPLDVWYKQQDVDSQMQNISLFWKALQQSEARGKILHYTVTFEALRHGESRAIETNVTTQTSYTRVTPKMGYKITVTADNSRGSSPPASILTDLGTQDLPSPQNVSAMAMGNNSILVSWEPPIKSTASISGYVVEWMSTHRKSGLEPHPSWIRLVASNLSVVIPEHIEDDVCYHISVFALYQDRAGQATSVRGYSGEKAPAAGPQVYARPQANGILVSWEEIPPQQQKGCITWYKIYLQRKASDVDPNVAIYNTTSRHPFHITDLQRGECYVLWMTALTDAGEGPWGNSELVCLESKGSDGGQGPAECGPHFVLPRGCKNKSVACVHGMFSTRSAVMCFHHRLPVSRDSCRHPSTIKYHCPQMPVLRSAPPIKTIKLPVFFSTSASYECCPV
uniref:Interleukin 12 receptor subunit beta 2 n=1 Tax=Coturnix japonica TaxID=93934 RepID=A0A8C2TU69_COTJA